MRKIIKQFIFFVIFMLIICLIWFLANEMFQQSFVAKLDNFGIVLGDVLAVLTVLFALFGFLNKDYIKRWWAKRKYENLGMPFQKRVGAIVIPVSPHPEQPEWILNCLKPKHVSLIYSSKSKDVAKNLATAYSGPMTFFPNAQDIELEKNMLKNVHRPEEIKQLVSKFISHFKNEGLSDNEIFVDLTGGTVPMSIGAFQAAEENAVTTIYIAGTKNGLIKNPKNCSQGNPIFISQKS